jgi:ribosomal protein S18 acetylase RimI-like enzyme
MPVNSAAGNRIELISLDPHNPELAQQIHAIRMLAYQQEAQLLGVSHFPPLEQTVADILGSQELFTGAFEGDALAAVISICPDDEGRGMCLSSLVVHPTYQRRGLGRALVKSAIDRAGDTVFYVQTAVANAPALALYERLGFRELRRWRVGSESLEVLELVKSL